MVTVRRLSNKTQHDPKFAIKTVKHPETVMVWAAFSESKSIEDCITFPRKSYEAKLLYMFSKIIC